MHLILYQILIVIRIILEIKEELIIVSQNITFSDLRIFSINWPIIIVLKSGNIYHNIPILISIINGIVNILDIKK